MFRRTRVHLESAEDAAALSAIPKDFLTAFLDKDDELRDAETAATVDFTAPLLDLDEHRRRNGPFMELKDAVPPPPMPKECSTTSTATRRSTWSARWSVS